MFMALLRPMVRFYSNMTVTVRVAQQWTVRNYGDGKISLMSVNANKAIDVPGANYSSNVALQLYSPNDTAAQQWIIEKI